MSEVQWATAFLDTVTERSADAERFWCEVTGQVLSAPRGERAEFSLLLPDDGDPFLRVQRVGQSVPGGLHIDLHTDDVDDLAARAEALGASASYLESGLVVLGSPGGMTFCIVAGTQGRRPSPQAWPGGRSLVDQVCLDIPPSRFDAELAFWSELTGWTVRTNGLPEFVNLDPPETMPIQFLLQRLDDEQSVVTAHLDLSSDDMEAEAERHQSLGARLVRRTPHWVTLVDPIGREYCVTRRNPPPDGSG